jgi:DNA-binding CsgD family transcriptional regulator/tetratricopeptide (TPR) repeat protein
MSVLPAQLRLAPTFPFVGRSRELAALRMLMPRAEAETGRAALLSGEPGSGKSRLLRELAREFAAEGAAVLYGACDAVVATPYRPFVEALDQLVRTADPSTLRDDLGPSGGELTRLLPDLEARVGKLTGPAGADADAERHRLHTAVTDLLAGAGRRAPLLLALEDLHWADVPTLLLLRHLVRASAGVRMLLLATFRDTDSDATEGLAETLAEVARSEGVVRLRLSGLSGEEVTEFLERATGVRAGSGLAGAIGALTGGNAFLLTELWRELVETDALEVSGGTVRLARPLEELGTPETVREVVTQRLARLAPPTTAVLELAAVAGPEFSLATLRRAAGGAEAELLAALDDGVRSGMIEAATPHGLSYRFTHELVRRALYDRLAASRKAELHLAVAHALEDGSAGPRGPLLADLAYHFAAAAPVGGAERAVEYNLLAAEAATASLAFGEAVQRLQTALALGIDDRRKRAEAALALGVADHHAGRSVEAIDAFAEAAELARELGDRELLARAAIGYEEACWRPGIAEAGAVELLEEAAAELDRSHTELRVRLLGGLARALEFQGRRDRGAIVRDEAIGLARRSGDRRGLASVLNAAYWAQGTNSFEEIHRMLGEARAIGDELGDDEIRAEALSWTVPTLVSLLDHDAARKTLVQLFETARRLREPFRLHVAEHYASALALCDGDLVEAEAAARRSHEWSRLLTGRDASGVYGIQMFNVRREQGRLEEVAPVIRVLAAGERAGAWRPGLIAVLAELGMEAEARRELARVRADGLDELRPSLWLASLAYLADATAVLRDAESAAEIYRELLPRSGENVMIGHLVSCYGAADRYLGMVAGVLGEWERAETHFEAALELNTRLGARTWLAHTYFEHARVLFTRGAARDRSRATALLGEAVSLGEAIGLRSITSRAAGFASAPPPPAAALPDGLSPREAAILRLVARGLSNREIGRELVISEHTAANHVRNILRKTRCANRTEATAYAHRRGLVQA